MACKRVGGWRKSVAIFCGMLFGAFVGLLPPVGKAHDRRARQAMAARMGAADVQAWGATVTVTTPDGRTVRVLRPGAPKSNPGPTAEGQKFKKN